MKKNPPHVSNAHKDLEYYSDKYIENIYTGKNTVRKLTGQLVMENYISRYVNVIDGMRVTTDQPEGCESKVHIFGPSIAYGFGVEDKYTLASCLQRLLNKQKVNQYKVFNYGVRGLPLMEYGHIIDNADITDNDDIVCIIAGAASKECKEILLAHKGAVVDLTDYFQRPHEYGEVFFEQGHFNYKGYMHSADILFHLMFDISDKIEQKEAIHKNEEISEISNSDEFCSYLNFLDSYKTESKVDAESVVGGIVMNANPFTLGHYYLIDIASRMVDYLYVFVVEEDKSAFSFKDRMNMVEKGTKKLINVKVIPSGKFIISNIKFPEYFDKDNATTTEVVPSLDIELFGKYIAKRLGISVRFVGEEPTDYITSIYNSCMKEKLPQYGIKLIEIPRLKKKGSVISAKRVRQLICLGGEYTEEVKALLPPTSYQYMREKKLI